MKSPKILLALAVAAGVAAPLFGALSADQKEVFEALGWLQANGLRQQVQGAVQQGLFTQEEADAIMAGAVKGIAQEKASFDEQTMMPKIQTVMEAKQKTFTEKLEAKAKADIEKMKNFLEELDKKPNVKKTASGLRYEIIEESTGAKPTADDVVLVHYVGKLTNGDTFDSSVDRGEPATFPLKGVIPAWTEGLQLIGKGGKIKLYAPADLAYGAQGVPPVIPPNATLVFDVELLDINPAAPAAPAPKADAK